jgi:hypothetical protein
MAQHPLPDLAAAFELDDPGERVRAVLVRLYGWYRETEPLFGKLFSDRASVPELDQFMGETMDRTQGELAGGLAAAFRVRGRRGEQLHALIRLALEFWTWRRLSREGLDDKAAADLMAAAIAAHAA